MVVRSVSCSLDRSRLHIDRVGGRCEFLLQPPDGVAGFLSHLTSSVGCLNTNLCRSALHVLTDNASRVERHVAHLAGRLHGFVLHATCGRCDPVAKPSDPAGHLVVALTTGAGTEDVCTAADHQHAEKAVAALPSAGAAHRIGERTPRLPLAIELIVQSLDLVPEATLPPIHRTVAQCGALVADAFCDACRVEHLSTDLPSIGCVPFTLREGCYPFERVGMHGLSQRAGPRQDGAMPRRTYVLQRITGELAAASTDDEIAQIACAGAMASVDVTVGAVILIEDDTMIVGAVQGYPEEITPEHRSPVDDRDGFLDAVGASTVRFCG